jgi:sensor domain CHASE-containing protein
MGDLEEKIMEEKRFSFSFKDLKWVISTLVVGISWIITIVLWIQDKNRQKSRIEVLETKNGTLEIQVATLNGQVSGVNQAAKIFMENPPSLNNYRIELLEKRVDFIENHNGLESRRNIPTNSTPMRRER